MDSKIIFFSITLQFSSVAAINITTVLDQLPPAAISGSSGGVATSVVAVGDVGNEWSVSGGGGLVARVAEEQS
nr:mucin-1-like [Ipomoea trifida]